MKTFEEQIKKWEGKANFITPIPNTADIPDIFKATLDLIYLNCSVKGGDVYSASSFKETFPNSTRFKIVPDINKCRLSADGVKKLAQSAGIEWDQSGCGIVRKTEDEIYYQVVAGIRKPDGQFYKINSVYPKDLKVIRDGLEDTHLSEKAYKTWSGYSNNQNKTRNDFNIQGKLKIEKDMRRNRSFLTQLAETGAKTRAVKELLSLKKEYTQDELKLPFIAVKIVIDYNTKNPLMQAALIAGLVDSTNSLFGKAKQMKEIPAYREEETIQEGEIEDKKEDIPQTVDFENSDKEIQIKTLKEIAENKKYNLDDYLKRSGKKLEDLSELIRIDLYKFIADIKEDSIPF